MVSGWEAGDLELGSAGIWLWHRAGLIKTDLMRGVEGPWAQRSLVLDGGCGCCVARVTGYKAMKTLIKEVTELYFITWLCSD